MSAGERKGEKAEVVSKFRRNEKDTGSTEVQVALLTKRIEMMVKHFAKSPKDHHSRRGMLLMISRRKGLLEYLKREDANRYRTTVAALGLRK